jgi:hypothetical protein
MPGDSELAHQEYAQDCVQRGGYFLRHWHTAPRQAQHDNIITAAVILEKTGQHAASVPAITEDML